MGTCDVCNETTSYEDGTPYTAEGFRDLVDGGFVPGPRAMVQLRPRIALYGMTERQWLARWKQTVTEDTTGWLLCPSCAAEASKLLVS